MQISINKAMLYVFDWQLHAPSGNLTDLTQGDEVIKVYIQEIQGCQTMTPYIIPILQQGQPFASLQARLLYEKHACSKPYPYVFVSVRILRGSTGRLIYTSDFMLSVPYDANKIMSRIPIYRVWYSDEK
ncbi:unnamed protein product [Rotaria sordida]|uniref:Uncharacterized protein n=1 Tax=Rotaria sordida TaxID=392033 RepID=A0A814IZ16_9BILA|nr:unnamed protein product [Rotaria sordida]CAF0949710.1 unnamed protein product [Rotaria sordida]CAF1029729.1 unnamed protein product [Rotaria sordida]CAF3715136.1 unnamed protein product [Rotaria sordida]CAF3865850.1 unnamed protein product [Rotaria sordida]